MNAGILLMIAYWVIFTVRKHFTPKLAAATKANTYDLNRGDPETRRAALFSYRYFGGFRGSEAVLAATEEACRVAVRVMREYLEQKGGEPT